MEKEEVLEVEEQIQKALEKENNSTDNPKPNEVLETTQNSIMSTETVQSKLSTIDLESSKNVQSTKSVETTLVNEKIPCDSTISKVSKTSISSNVSPSSKKAEGSKHF